MQEQLDILMGMARAYMILAQGLKEQNLPHKHYALSGKKCCMEAIRIKSILEDIDKYMERKAA
jgi:hypothetical protein